MNRLLIIVSLCISMTGIAFAVKDVMPGDFKSEEERQRFKHLVEIVRCTVCQNQNVADSNAELARELRVLILDMIQDGKSDKEILDKLVSSYGEFVLYKPLFTTSNYFIWFGPFVILIIALLVMFMIVRARKKSPSIISDDEQQSLRESLEKFTNTDNKEKD